MELEAGQRVVLHGLKGAAELNGREGVLRGAADAATGRWEVCLARRGAEGAKAVRVKAANLRPAAGEGQLGQGHLGQEQKLQTAKTRGGAAPAEEGARPLSTADQRRGEAQSRARCGAASQGSEQGGARGGGGHRGRGGSGGGGAGGDGPGGDAARMLPRGHELRARQGAPRVAPRGSE